MIAKTRPEAQTSIDELCRSAWTLSALAVSLERGIARSIHAPASARELAARLGISEALIASVLDVLNAAGLVVKAGERYALSPGLGAVLNESGADTLQADLRSTLATNAQMVLAARHPTCSIGGWRTDDAVAVEAQGNVSRAVMRRLLAEVFPGLPGLDQRLRADGALALDVGAGAAGIPITLCQHYPALRMVALDPSRSAIAIGTEQVRRAGLADRIELREQPGEALGDLDAYDFAYVAQMFFPDAVVDDALRATVRALKPGGYLLTGAACGPGSSLPEAVSRLRSVAWCGSTRFASDVQERLSTAGLSDVRPGPAYGALQWIVGQRQV